ncbi:MAG: NUDIX domain-containing protein [Caldilineaceae bacterium]|nr:NUDIX domain-containing protein [Caldilineaceae bacterium]
MSDGPVIARKVTALITCRHQDRDYLLIFRHPYAGIQIPAGTVEDGEDVSTAARREAAEETGLSEFGAERFLGKREEVLPEGMALMAVTSPVYSRPDTSSFDWASIRNGIAVQVLRQQDGFTQVNYEEWDRWEDAQYISFCITGWVLSSALATQRDRHFYHFAVQGDPSQTWHVATDNHRFQLFWAPLDDLPEINPHQSWWPQMLSSR